MNSYRWSSSLVRVEVIEIGKAAFLVGGWRNRRLVGVTIESFWYVGEDC